MLKLSAALLFLAITLLSSPLASAQPQEAAVYTTTMTYQVRNVGNYVAVNSRATIYFFDNFSGWGSQEVVSESIKVDGVAVQPEIFQTEDDRWAQLTLGDLDPGQTRTIEVVQVLRVGTVDLEIDPNYVGTTIPQNLLSETQPIDGLWESDDPSIRDLALRLTENTTNFYFKVRQIFDFILEDPNNGHPLSYERQQAEHGALWALQNRVGDCTEFTNLLIALLRAVGIPARAVPGYAYLPLYDVTGASADANQLGHVWPIFYLPNYGWVPADAVWPRFIGSFGNLDYMHLAGAVTDGVGIIRQGEIRWPGPGIISTNWQHYVGQETTLSSSWSGTITPEVLITSTLQLTSQVQDDVIGLTLVIKNMGRSTANDLVADLDLDGNYFEMLTEPQRKESLLSREQWVAEFVVRVKDPAFGTIQSIESHVTFDSSDGPAMGSFLSTDSTSTTIAPEPVTPPPSPSDNMVLYLIIAVIVVAIAAVAIVFARR